MSTVEDGITYLVSPPVTNEALNALFGAAWPEHRTSDFTMVLSRSLCHICAYQGIQLVGFVNVAWDGGIHAFILDTTVHPAVQRRGIGVALVRQAAEAACQHGIEWLHVDFEPHLEHFYQKCGFQHTAAGLMKLQVEDE
jgi:GNAT superfamily N-acetyltransferase